MSEALALLLRLNLAAGAAVALAMLLRQPARRLFGPRVAYGLWALVPLAALAMVLPARVVTISQPLAPTGPEPLIAFTGSAAATLLPSAPSLSAILLGLWGLGVLAALAHLVWRQAQFSRAVRAGRAGPAVVGVLRPRIVTPDDFPHRYTPREQRVVLAHEATHIIRQDPRINALVALARCANWFNPLVHVLAHHLRIDQELACDAQVIAAHPAVRRSYAEAMLKTQLAAQPLPLGCYWLAPSAHPLAERIGLLTRKPPTLAARRLGAAAVAVVTLGAAWAAWSARPAQVVVAAAAPSDPSGAPHPTAASSAAPSARLATATPRLQRLAVQRVATAAEPAQEPIQEPFLTPDGAPVAPLPEATDDPARRSPDRRLLTPGEFGPGKIRALASWSQVEPGSAVRVLATMNDPDGRQLTTDLTAFGSQSWYRLGVIERNSSRYKLFTSVIQNGQRLHVIAGLNRAFNPMLSGAIDLASGETGAITLPNGLVVKVTPTLRPETPAEIAEAQRVGRPKVSVEMNPIRL